MPITGGRSVDRRVETRARARDTPPSQVQQSFFYGPSAWLTTRRGLQRRIYLPTAVLEGNGGSRIGRVERNCTLNKLIFIMIKPRILYAVTVNEIAGNE